MGEMDPYRSPYIIPNNSLHNPFPHSLLRTRQSRAWSFMAGRFRASGFRAHGFRDWGIKAKLLLGV